MDRAILEDKLQNLEKQFETLNQEKAQHEKSASDIEAELFRLQGDYRTLRDLLNLPAGETPTDATTLVAEPAEETKSEDAADQPTD